jgi:DNA-binding response OmpR family regulator
LINLNILIAEDEEKIRKLVAGYLNREGFKTAEACDGKQALEMFEKSSDFSLIILDVMMPYLDGFEVCRRIREVSEVPIVMLTARDSEYDELTGFNCGADEYISKPFSSTILVTRVKNLLKRTSSAVGKPIEIEGLKISYREREVMADQRRVSLTPKEFELLYYLVQNRNIVLSRDQILNMVWDMDFYGDDRTVDTHIKCLRAKLGDYGRHIVTLRKVGYKFECYG